MKRLLHIDIGKNRLYGLDILRCVAILCVVVEHSLAVLPLRLRGPLNVLVFDGVSIFFVLSGFLIGGIFIKEFSKKKLATDTLLEFWQRRWYRTLPNYLLILTVLLLLNVIFTEGFRVLDVTSYFVFSQNLALPHPKFFPEAWSLSIEEWFYLTVPIFIFAIVALFRQSVRKAIIITAVAVLIAVTLFRLYRFYQVPLYTYNDWDNHFRKQVITRLDSLMYGVIGAYISYYHQAVWLRYKKPLFVIGLVLLLSLKFIFTNPVSLYHCVFSFSVNALATLALLPYLGQVRSGRGSVYKAVTYISLISYSMYLINLSLVRTWIIRNLDLSMLNIYAAFILKYLLFWSLTIVLSILIFKYFEIPTTRLRDRKRVSGTSRALAKAA